MKNAVLTFDPLSAARRGLSLLEVLAATFVLMIGLLGMIAIIPFGIYQVSRINQADYGGNLGRTAQQEVKIREFDVNVERSIFDPYDREDTFTTVTVLDAGGNPVNYNPLLGVSYTADQEPNLTGSGIGSSVNFIRCDVPFIVDPLAVESHCDDSANPNKSSIITDLDPISPNFNSLGVYITGTAPTPDSICYFPYGDSNGMPRITCELTQPRLLPETAPGLNDSERGDKPGPYLARPFKAKEIFYSHEDTVFASPAIPKVKTPRPVGVVDTTGDLQTYGGYSWLYMVTPQARGNRYHIAKDASGDFVYIPDTNSPTPPPGRHTPEGDVISSPDPFRIDIVVFYNRSIDPTALAATERTVGVDMSRSSIGLKGGEYTIESSRAEELDLTDTKWILLSCQQNGSSDPLLFTEWCEVANSREIYFDTTTNRYKRIVMLNHSNAVPQPSPAANYQVTIAKGVVRVY